MSASTRDFLVRERAVPAERVRLIYNGAPLDEFAPGGPERGWRVRRELSLPAEAMVVGSIGRLNAQKGHRHLLDAMPALLARHPTARVLVVGDGDLKDELEAQARRLGVAESVTFAGHRADVPDVLAAIDVFCISSLYEGTPLALFEAMAAGRAIVSTAVDGCREVLEEGTTGLMVPPADPAAFARALDRVVGDAALREALGRRALEASRRFDVGACVEQMEALYDDVLAGGGT